MMCPSIHTTQTHRLVQGDRILLKDLRVLEVTQVVPQQDGFTVRYYELATKESGSLALVKGQFLKIICGSVRGCSVGQEVAELI